MAHNRYALIGNDEEAISCGKKAVELKPIKLDAWQGVVKEQDLMEIYILTGNYDLALDKIEFLISTPSELSVGKLMVDPIFDNLRNLPRFQKIIDSSEAAKTEIISLRHYKLLITSDVKLGSDLIP